MAIKVTVKCRKGCMELLPWLLFIVLLLCRIDVSTSLGDTRNPIWCFPPDANALLDFWAQLKDPSEALSSWDDLTDCCGWKGVTCSQATASSLGRRVTGLHLMPDDDSAFLSLDARASDVVAAGLPLSRLSHLETLSLMSVTFKSDIPSSWGTLARLKSLSLVDCSFTGNIPQSFSSLPNLQHLYLSNNKLTGRLPPVFSNSSSLQSLQSLDMSSNFLIGSISAIFRLHNLSYLDLSGNQFGDEPIVDQFACLPRLRHLDLARNHLKHSIPESLRNIAELQYLDLSSNELEGAIPPALFQLPRLTTALLYDNHFSGRIPSKLPSDSRIEVIDLSNNSMSGTIPPAIAELRQLQSLDLSFNKLTGPIPDGLASNSRLEFLFLEANGLDGAIPQELARLSSLVLANVSHNLLSGPIPDGPWQSFPLSAFAYNAGLSGPRLHASGSALF